MTVNVTDFDPTLTSYSSVVLNGVCHACHTLYDQAPPNVSRTTIYCDHSVTVNHLHDDTQPRGDVDAPMCSDCWPEAVDE